MFIPPMCVATVEIHPWLQAAHFTGKDGHYHEASHKVCKGKPYNALAALLHDLLVFLLRNSFTNML